MKGLKCAFLFAAFSCLVLTPFALFGQNADRSPMSPSAAHPGYTRHAPVPVTNVQVPSGSPVLDFPANARTSRGGRGIDENGVAAWNSSSNRSNGIANSNADSNPLNTAVMGNGSIFGLDTIDTFEGAFAATGGPDQGVVFPYPMIGNSPAQGGTTVIPAKITTVTLKLLNADGSLRTTMSYDPFTNATLQSPVFEKALFGTGRSQFPDAIQRAEFFNTMKSNWHTELSPTIVNSITITVPRFVNVRLPNGNIVQVQNYFFGTAPNGDPFIELLDLFFDSVYTNSVINDIIAGNNTTDALNMEFYPNTFLFSIDQNGQFANCCVLGFHTFFLDSSAVPQPRWITLFASWLSPGLFNGGFQDITPLSHEVSEAYNDPFTDTAVPVWQFPGVPANDSVDCQGNLETGDPLEVLSDATFPVPLGHGKNIVTYHPQTEALLQWFSQGPASNAIDGAWSYPNENALTRSALPCPASGGGGTASSADND